jgi:hypothetical protein
MSAQKFLLIHLDLSIFDAKFQPMFCENYPGRFPHMQVVVLRHVLPGPEFLAIIFAV